MEHVAANVIETEEAWPLLTDERGTRASAKLEHERARWTRTRWYIFAALAAVAGAFATAEVHRVTGAYYPFISGFAMILVVAGGFGPAVVASLGSMALAHVVPPMGVMLPHSTGEIVRLAANGTLLGVSSTLAGLIRRHRIAMYEREARLERAVASVSELLEGSSDAIALTDRDLRITYVNGRAERMFGFAHGAAIGRALDEIITPESMTRRPFQLDVLNAGQTIRTDRTAFRADGSIIDIEISARLLRGGRLLATIRDVGESKREAARQRAERDLLNAILATSVAGVLTVDMAGSITFANRRAESLLELTRSEPSSPYDAPAFRQASLSGGLWSRESQPFRQVVDTGATIFDVRLAIVWSDGRRKALSVNGAPLRDASGQLQSVVFAVNDITSALAAAEALRESDRQLVRITDAMPGIVYQYVIEANGRDRFVFVSRFGETLLGRSAEQLLSNVESAWSLVHPDDIGPTRQSLMQSFRTMASWIHEFRIQDVHSAGSWRWVSGHAVPQPGPDEGSVLWNGIFIDITDRKTLEDDLRQAQRIESVGLLAGGIAHDFNNLLTVILGEAELLAIDLRADSAQAAGVQQIRNAAASGAALTRQLLGFARKQVMAPRVIDINELVRRVPPLIGRLLGESIELDLQLMDHPPRVVVDPAQLDQVLVNLVVNARDAMPGGGRLDIRTRVIEADASVHLEGATLPAGPLAEICVRDSGIGMTDEVRDRAFEPFFTTKGIGKGTGLGLATSYGIVSQADGTIVINSVRGQGTSVRVLLPISNDVASAARARTRSTTPTGHETILVVDDDAAVRHVTATALRRQGYRVLEADSGQSALEQSRAERARVHLLVTDVAMPQMSGPALAAQLVLERPDTRVLYVSGYAEEGIAHRGVLDDGVAMLQKPYDIRELARRVRSLLELKVPTLSESRVEQGLIDERPEASADVTAVGELLYHEHDDQSFDGIDQIG